MISPTDEDEAALAPIWPVFGDLMACLFGLFVLFFVWAVAFQVDLTRSLEKERASREVETARLKTLEQAFAGPLAEGRITLIDGRIGIRGNVLFDLSSADLESGGSSLLTGLAAPLKSYLADHDELIMISGFTDDRPITASRQGYKDNWQLSAERALTVTRALVAAGVPADAIFAAGFGAGHPVAPNDTSENRALNRRVEISPIPRKAAK